MARAWGGSDGSVAGFWAAIVASLSRAGGQAHAPPAGADQARHRLARMLARLDGSRELVIQLAEGRATPLVARVLEDRLTRRDHAALEQLREGLDRMA